jgi:hypothetical protein
MFTPLSSFLARKKAAPVSRDGHDACCCGYPQFRIVGIIAQAKFTRKVRKFAAEIHIDACEP